MISFTAVNLNQEVRNIYFKECQRSFYKLALFIDRVFDNIEWQDTMQSSLAQRWYDKPVFSIQVSNKDRDRLIELYCDVDYYCFLTPKIREYKLKKRLGKV